MDKLDANGSGIPSAIESIHLGVWRVLREKRAPLEFREKWTNCVNNLLVVRRLASDVYRLGPHLFLLIVFAKVWASAEAVLLLYLSTRLLNIIEVGLKEGQPDTYAIANAVMARLVCLLVAAIVGSCSDRARPTLRNRVLLFFDEHSIRSKLKADIPTSQGNGARMMIIVDNAWYSCDALLTFATTVFSTVWQLGFVLQLSQSNKHGPLFALLCLAKPMIRTAFRRSLWSKAHIVQAYNRDFIRMQKLKELGEPKFRQDIISGNIVQYILKEYDKARQALGDISVGAAHSQYHDPQSFALNVVGELASDLPMIYYAANAVLNPGKFSLTSIAMLQHSSNLLRSTFYSLTSDFGNIHKKVNSIKQVYDAEIVRNVITEGSLNYPQSGVNSPAGMAFELRNVTFTYPGTKSKEVALKDVSFAIAPGQLVVIVGANGSGKSTIVKLLTRLYDVSGGEILVDGQKIQDYQIADLRQATASLTQDHNLYPLSIAENIGIGYPDRVSDLDLVNDAARKGGAESFVSKLAYGISTVLESNTVEYTIDVKRGDKTALAEAMEGLEKTVDVSGGERQRLVASRIFMRFNSEKVRFVAVDEPSSALDPEGELELFDNLRSVRAGKTMVFVTHRFGHLTKHADLILCMKDGNIVESGTHQELTALNGEYMKLYRIQARAFE